VGVTGIFGGAFDPPHNGHVALVRDAQRRFALDRLVILVSADPGHKTVHLAPEVRLDLARAAFPGAQVELDEHPRTVDMLRARRFDDPLFLIGADEFRDFLDWKDPEGVLDLTRLAVGTRPGYPQGPIEHVLEGLGRPDRVEFFEIEPVPVASRDLRARLERGEQVDDLVPAAVADEIRRLGLYRPGGYTECAISARTEEH
jgi:nicotinate-nucleotide adenylyltransferase